MKSVLIWAQASSDIGAGHVHRCHTLAASIKRQSSDTHIVWVAEEPTVKTQPWLQESKIIDLWIGLQELYYYSDYDWAIIDDYRCEAEDETALRSIAQSIMVIDDQPNRQHDADVLLDQTFDRSADEYLNQVPDHCALLVGSKYVLLKPEFVSLRDKAVEKRQQLSEVKQVLVSVGATDPKCLTLKILQALSNAEGDFSIRVVVSSMMPDLQAIQNFANISDTPIRLELDTHDMAQKILDADLAIGAAGMTTWERAALGLPSIVFQVADNQSDNIRKISEAGIAEVCTSSEDFASEELLQKFERLMASQKLRQQISARGFEILDGQGADRVTQTLLSKSKG